MFAATVIDNATQTTAKVNQSLFDQFMSTLQSILPRIPNAVITILLGILMIRLISWGIRFALSHGRLPRGLVGILVSVVDSLLWAFLIISVLQVLGLGSLALVLSGGVAAVGLALGAGASGLAADILAGIFLAQDPDFNIGDVVEAGEKATRGTIESMDMRRTRIRDAEGLLHILPNSVVERKDWVVIQPAGKPKPAVSLLKQRLASRRAKSAK